MILIIISLTLLLADIIVASLYSGKLPTCVSQCWYINGWLHYFLLAGCAISLMPAMISATPDNFQILAFASCAALVFVATAPEYLDKSQKIIHSVSAIVCAACAIAWAIVTMPIGLFGCSLLILAIAEKRCRLLWLELSAFATVYIAMLVSYF